MLRRVSLKVKLVSAFMVTALLVVGLGYVNLQALNSVHTSFSNIVDNHTPRLIALQEMRLLAVKIEQQTAVYQSQQAINKDIEAQKNQLLANLEKLTDQEKDYQVLAAANEPPKRSQILAVFKPVAAAKEETINNAFELISLKEQKASQSLLAAKEAELATSQVTLETAIGVATEQDLDDMGAANEAADARVQQQTAASVAAVAAVGIFGLVVGLMLSITIARNIKKLKDGSARIAGGDFGRQISITSQDELGDLAIAFNQMSGSLQTSYRHLALEKQRAETVLESMGEGLIALDDQGRVVLINTVAATLLGFGSQTKPVGQIAANIMPLHDADDVLVAPARQPGSLAMQAGRSVNDVYALYAKDKRKILLSIVSSSITLEGRVAGAILVLRDVTKEKEVDRMKTEFISLASHQLRTPLSAIRWFSDMLLDGDAGELQPEQKEFAKTIADSTSRMIELVNSLLNVSRMESGRILIDPKPTDLRELISGIISDLKAKTEEQEQSLIISIHADLPKINLDGRLIGQVYMNLLTNAIKYTPKGGEISVIVSKKDDQVISQVTDNGYGIPKAQQGRVFQKFFRAENVIKHVTDGTGLGLYLIKAIIESSGGKLWFESEEDKGTTFWFSLPLSGMKPKEGEVTLDS
jgi:PAS domain S-box-containing protein